MFETTRRDGAWSESTVELTNELDTGHALGTFANLPKAKPALETAEPRASDVA